MALQEHLKPTTTFALQDLLTRATRGTREVLYDSDQGPIGALLKIAELIGAENGTPERLRGLQQIFKEMQVNLQAGRAEVVAHLMERNQPFTDQRIAAILSSQDRAGSSADLAGLRVFRLPMQYKEVVSDFSYVTVHPDDYESFVEGLTGTSIQGIQAAMNERNPSVNPRSERQYQSTTGTQIPGIYLISDYSAYTGALIQTQGHIGMDAGAIMDHFAVAQHGF